VLTPRLSWNQNDFAGRAPALERAVRRGDVAQWELVLDAQAQLPGRDPAEDVGRARDQLLARRRVMVQAGRVT